MRALKAILNPQRLSEVWRCRRLTPDWLLLTAAYLHLYRRYPLMIRTRTGPVELRTKFDVATFWLIHMGLSYQLPANANLVVDAGANIGAFTLYVLQNSTQSRIISLEPAPDTFERMAATVRQHNFNERCTPLQKALGDAPGTTFINLNLESQFRSTGGSEGVRVPVTTLEQIISEYGPIDLLKLDAEGAEYPSLMHAPQSVLEKIGCIAMEYHPVEGANPHNYSSSHLLSHLASQGFEIVKSRDDGGGYGMAHLLQKGWESGHIM
jgi:FkbM family methyltransferase